MADNQAEIGMITMGITHTTESDIIATLRASELEVITSYTLADAIREGATVTEQSFNWGQGGVACALSAARLAARARGYLA